MKEMNELFLHEITQSYKNLSTTNVPNGYSFDGIILIDVYQADLDNRKEFKISLFSTIDKSILPIRDKIYAINDLRIKELGYFGIRSGTVVMILERPLSYGSIKNRLSYKT